MTATVSDVRAWNTSLLSFTANRLQGVRRVVDGQQDNLVSEQNVLAESWHGDAAIAAAECVVGEASTFAALAEVLGQIAVDFEAAQAELNRSRSDLLDIVDDLTNRGLDVDDSGVVSADRVVASLRMMAGPLAEDAVLSVQICAQEGTISALAALRRANDTAAGLCSVLRIRLASVGECLSRAASGNLVKNDSGGFSWRPDVPAMAAGVAIGGMADATGHALSTAAAASADDVALGIGKRLGPLGAALGTVPAISNDIEGGMDPTKAVVTESAGTVVGVVAGGVAGQVVSAAVTGSMIGSVVPGAGTAVGLVVGVAVGALAAYLVPKSTQWLWD